MITAESSNALIDVSGPDGFVRLVVVVLVMAALAAWLRRATGLGDGRAELTATVRATVQLGVVGLLIAGVLASWWLTAAFVTVMVVVAALTSGGRMGLRGAARVWPLLPVAIGAVPLTAGLLFVGLLPLEPVSVIPTGGILIGNAMTATTLAGRRALDALTERRGEFEAGLSIGLLPRDAALLVTREAARLSLIPGLDQTRTVGLVTLPGAFVGTLLGGASPLEAAALQLVVLAGILLAQSVAVPLTLELVVRGRMSRA
ncbi:ABC transporter permease [Mobilicoccus caccae]|uniref:ABC transporter permease n=1 Tax=Mobilicoccus caccae TaxID=1859295 RepID=A0ABQ6IRW2_9MICO|nr:ABC transporter permease [Mobilicoccus caccae]GMA40018.1 ABC transporter permease [Mobilicoccus caccae]